MYKPQQAGSCYVLLGWSSAAEQLLSCTHVCALSRIHVYALAALVDKAPAAGQRLVRINLSEQTDIMDLLGADLPVEGGAAGEFAW